MNTNRVCGDSLKASDWLADIDAHHSKKYSQAGQDGLIEYIFKNIGTTNKFCVEFGFNSWTLDGGSGANVARLVLEDGWEAMLFDDEHENPDIYLARKHLTSENLEDTFDYYGVPLEPDYVSIDVDGADLWLMRAVLEGFSPRLLSIEYNARFPIDVAATMRPWSPKWENDAAYGASLMALWLVAEEFNYGLIAVEDGLDAFFLRDHTGVALDKFKKFTDHYVHPAPTKDRAKLMVKYPSLEPLEKYPW